MKIVFFGSSKYILPTIKMLKDNFDLGLVVTTELDPADSVPAYCTEAAIPFLSVKNLKDEAIVGKIKSINAKVGILGYFGLIVPQELLTIFPKGIVNIHPSLLPKYRGPTPVQSAILNGDKETGVSIIVLDYEVDHGPMLTRQKEKILPTDTTDSLHTRLFSVGAELIKEVLPKYLKDQLSPAEQNHTAATHTKELSKSDGQFDINNPPSKDKLDRMIRAYFPWPTAWTMMSFKGKALRVKFLPCSVCHPANITRHPENSNRHPERSEGSLPVNRQVNKDSSAKPQNDSEFCIQVEGGKPMSVKDFLNGYPKMRNVIDKLVS